LVNGQLDNLFFMQPSLKSLFWIGLIFTTFSCNSNQDDSPSLKFTPEHLATFHGGAEKSWRIVGLYENYSANSFSDFNECFTDDIYTFKSDTDQVAVALGSSYCYWSSPDEAVANVEYSYDEAEGRIFLNQQRGEGFGDAFASQFFFLELEEMTANRLVFTDKRDEKYLKTTILELME
jgi:hypothetical protein